MNLYCRRHDPAFPQPLPPRPKLTPKPHKIIIFIMMEEGDMMMWKGMDNNLLQVAVRMVTKIPLEDIKQYDYTLKDGEPLLLEKSLKENRIGALTNVYMHRKEP